MCVLAPGLSLSIIVTLLSMCGTKILLILVSHIDSRVIIIDNERPGASPCDSRGRLHANNTKSIVLYNIRLHVHILRFHFLLLAVASDKAYQLLAHGRWFSPASSTTKTGRHDIAEILLKVAFSTKNQINHFFLQIENKQ